MSKKYNDLYKTNKRYILLLSFILFLYLLGNKNLNIIHVSLKHDFEKNYINAKTLLDDSSKEIKLLDLILVDRNGDSKKDPKKAMETSLRGKYKIENTTYIKNGITYVENLKDVGVLVNKNRCITSSYEPEELSRVNIPFHRTSFSKESMMVNEAARAAEKLVGDASNEKFYLKGVSAYRSYNNQETTYSYISKTKGEKHADVYSARPGQSEHQTGLAIDLGIRSLNYDLNENFASTKEGTWLSQNCYKYGFVIRYPKGKEHITGYSFEPWHIRYVGVELAKYLTENNLTLEEFYSFK
ncbi:M15 family metallopeptidase [Hathewaya histolytica]|uniref:M15 family metallopeptidase n=1 Tax=Hathewaya histolytica TaxID=1498 RepID=UPI003B67BB28